MRRYTLSRRDFLAAASLAALAPRALRAEDDVELRRQEAKADAVIVLWMAGGMPHTETFDPKRHTPYQAGMKSQDVASTFPAVPTAVDGIRFSEGLERIGRVMDRGTLIRTHTAADLIRTADEAMYWVKRHGSNDIRGVLLGRAAQRGSTSA